ncbi:MAG TPA: hypothetical protein PLO57_06185 [Candidatus Cloacimonadota bacterium]|nr:hypothetical protein [Candidatus Cloacimonadota bacterium]
MGNQQILLIVLVVIIVGIAVAVGFNMFMQQKFQNNGSMIGQDTQRYLIQIQESYRLWTALNGLSRDLEGVNAEMLARNIGWGEENPMSSENGQYLIQVDIANTTVHVKSLGVESHGGLRPAVHGTIVFPEGKIETKRGDVDKDLEIAEVNLLGE